MYTAYYEDAAKVEKAAKEKGWTADSGSWHDFVKCEDNAFKTTKTFPALNKAVEWLKSEVATQGKTVYGEGTVVAWTHIPENKRCNHCICGGDQAIRIWTVTSTGIDSQRRIDSSCV